jgi:hypothetical protein
MMAAQLWSLGSRQWKMLVISTLSVPLKNIFKVIECWRAKQTDGTPRSVVGPAIGTLFASPGPRRPQMLYRLFDLRVAKIARLRVAGTTHGTAVHRRASAILGCPQRPRVIFCQPSPMVTGFPDISRASLGPRDPRTGLAGWRGIGSRARNTRRLSPLRMAGLWFRNERSMAGWPGKSPHVHERRSDLLL